MSIKKTLLMLTVNYILIFVWMFLYRMGFLTALIVFPLICLIVFFDTFLSVGNTSAILWCGNLLIANIVGILLNNYLYVRETGDMNTAILQCAVELPGVVLIIGIAAAISGHTAWKREKRRRTMDSVSGPEPVRNRDFGWAFSGGGSGFSDTSPDEDEEEPLEDTVYEEEDSEEEESRFRVIRK